MTALALPRPSAALPAALLAAALFAGCGPTGPHREHVSLSNDPDSLRAAFNADTGRVRVVAIASPT
jgi:hypothetical protein